MENNQTPSKKKLKSIKEDKILNGIGHNSLTRGPANSCKKLLCVDLEILQKTQKKPSQRVLITVKPRAPVIKTLYIAEKNRFYFKKNSDKSGSRLAVGDHSSFTTRYSESGSSILNTIECGLRRQHIGSSNELVNIHPVAIEVENSGNLKCSQSEISHPGLTLYNDRKRPAEKCYIFTQPQLNMNFHETEAKIGKSKDNPNKVDIATLIITNTSSEDSLSLSNSTFKKFHKRLDHLERKVLRQEMVFRSIDPNITISSSDEEVKDTTMRSTTGSGRPGCSYIQQYSHIPETSAFQRYAQQAAPLSPSKATTIEKEHNSEQYGRDFTTYDGITARGRRQCASVPCKRNDIPRLAAERVHKIRHKLNPVRDYRLMDTVHYLAQGEFAPRDDGIKLTPSREAVLSDIIWEDVCRTHWPNVRLGRRPDRCSARYDLQRLIDSLLRERVAHVERRRRRHYRIVKLNQRHESCNPVGKTGDIIVASHKNRRPNEDVVSSDHNADRRWEDQRPHRNHRSQDRMMYPDRRQKRRFQPEDCSPGPSCAVSRSPTNQEPTCCYQISPTTNEMSTGVKKKIIHCDKCQELTSGSSVTTSKPYSKGPRYVVKKDPFRRKNNANEEPNLEQYILLPTLVVRTPSNVKRQKKFNELYHRILNFQMNNAQNCVTDSEAVEKSSFEDTDKKNIGLNINITLSSSTEIVKNE